MKYKNAAPDFGDAETLQQETQESITLLQDYLDAINYFAQVLSRLLEVSEDKRVQRSEKTFVKEYEMKNQRIEGVVESQTTQGRIEYKTRITFDPRGHRCECPDWQQRGRTVGPCKHVVALGRAFWEHTLVPDLEYVQRSVKDVVDKVVYGSSILS